ncbi:peptidase C69 [Chlorella sorokiniana]|uniref:membrane dipeptidase n=1 Tax=Chlorella sorokiniana TaxID=3076 RepID=A0A2P6TJY7_CHLSO|nr:peptidase C69 [Chlorella sorokiniana]|eukprot:PRW44358.1 peptidase C69 [Chlorella sorokiniana]
MPSSRRGGPPGPDQHLLFTALLARNCSHAAQLLLGSQAQQLSHEGPAGFSSLHAAVLGGCSGQLLALVAAGADLNGALGASASATSLLSEPPDSPAGQLAEFLDSRGGARLDWRRVGSALSQGNTPLAVAAGGSALGPLRKLLHSTLALDLAARDSSGRTLLAVAAASPAAASAVPLLHAAGAPLTSDALMEHVQGLSPAAVKALLACGSPTIDTSKPDLVVQGQHGFSCAIHRALNAADRLLQDLPDSRGGRAEARRVEARALHVVDTLAADFRPTVYEGVSARLLEGLGLPTEPCRLDPFDVHSNLPEWLVYNLYAHPARDTPLFFRSNDNNMSITLPAPGLAYIAVPTSTSLTAASPDPTFEEVGINSAGVALSSTETIFSSDSALAADPLNLESGVLEDNIASILLPQMMSARQGVELLGQYIQQLGSAEGFGIQFADANEAWYLESVAGHQWIAHRIPDDSFFVSANQGRLQEADLSDTDNVLSSPGLMEFAEEHGLFNSSDDKPFNTFVAFMRNSTEQPDDPIYNWPRVCALQNELGDAGWTAESCAASRGLQPAFVQPSSPLQLADVFEALRNHYQGTPNDAYELRDPKDKWRPVAVLRTAMAHVTRMRAPEEGLPDGLSAINYIAMSMPALAPFVPIYKGLPEEALPLEMTNATANPDPVSLFWRARRLQVLIMQNWPVLAPEAQAGIRQWEADVEERLRPEMERRYKKAVDDGDQEGADAELAEWTADVAASAGDLLDSLAEAAASKLGMNALPDLAQTQSMLFNTGRALLLVALLAAAAARATAVSAAMAQAIDAQDSAAVAAAVASDGVETSAQALLQALLDGKSAQAVSVVAQAAATEPRILDAFTEAIAQVIATDQKAAADAFFAVQRQQLAGGGLPSPTSPLASAVVRGIAKAIAQGNGSEVAEDVARFEGTPAVALVFVQALQQAICDSPDAAAPAISTAITSPDTTPAASGGAAKAVAQAWSACCAAAAQAVSKAAEQNMGAFPQAFAKALATVKPARVPECFTAAVPEAVSTVLAGAGAGGGQDGQQGGGR